MTVKIDKVFLGGSQHCYKVTKGNNVIGTIANESGHKWDYCPTTSGILQGLSSDDLIMIADTIAINQRDVLLN